MKIAKNRKRMDSFPFMLVLTSLVLTYLVTEACGSPSEWAFLCGQANFTTNSLYSSNRRDLLSEFSSLKPNNYGFYNISVGENNKETANGIALCRGDVKESACISCINEAAERLPVQCSTHKEAILWSGTCMFRYSNRSMIYGEMDPRDTLYLVGDKKVTNPDDYSKVLPNLLDSLRNKAATGGSQRKYAAGNHPVEALFETVSALVQCTPDLTEAECNECLLLYMGRLPKCCEGKVEARISGTNCDIRYSIGKSYESDPSLMISFPSVSSVKGANFIWILVSGVCILIIFGIV